MARLLLITFTVSGDLSRDHHQWQSYRLWRKPAPMTRLISFARLGMNPNAMRFLTTVLLVATPMMKSCDSANDLDSCIKHPFRSSCEARLPDHYQQVRVNRLAFCRTEGNAGNELCTADTTFAHICTNYPFDAQCLGNDDYDQARQDACDTAGAGSTECRTLAGINCGTNPFSSYCGGGV